MILFLDVVSPLPEFSLIEDNKIVFSKKILTNSFDKMSDCIIPTYIDLEKKFSLDKKLELLVTNTGPGSYTALRVGIAFLSGLSLAKNINLIGLSCIELFRYVIKNEELSSSVIYITSSNNQNFFYFYSLKKNKYIINKIENDDNPLELHQLSIKKIFINSDLPEFQLELLNKRKYTKIVFHSIVSQNIKKIISLPKQDIIEPIYISNNKILN